MIQRSTSCYIIKKTLFMVMPITLKKANFNDPIVFSEWGLINNKVKRRDFNMNDLLINFL